MQKLALLEELGGPVNGATEAAGCAVTEGAGT
jgi:hypothetical protein